MPTATLRTPANTRPRQFCQFPGPFRIEATKLADLASYLVSPMAGYINGEMVTIDGGAHLRSSGAEDLLNWSPEQWADRKSVV